MSLLAPLYLLGLLGLLLPWLLHRFSHHEPPEQVFPTTRFLEPTTPPATSKRRLRYWPLLALRVLFLAGLCLLFAQPWLQSENDAANSDAVQLVVVDNSFSMRAGERWTLSKDAVKSALSEIPDSDAIQLFSYAGQLTTLTDITNDREMINAKLSQIEPGFESADFGDLMRRLNKVAGDIDKPVSAIFITDAQRSNLPQQMNTLLANRLQALKVVSVKSDAPINYSLHAEAVTSDSVVARVNVRVAASDVSATDSATANKTVQLEMQGRLLGTQEVNLKAGESKNIQFDAINLPSDINALMNVAFTEFDFLPEDDQLNIPVRGLSSVGIALTHIGREPIEQARVFISTALETNGDARIELLDASAAMSPSIRHAVVFVDDLADIPDAVKRFVDAGGNALLLPNVQARSNDATVSSNAALISRTDLAHALGLGDINWFDTKFYSTRAMSLDAGDQPLMSLDSGEPLLIERFVSDRGRLLLLNDGLDGFNSDLPLQPAFVLLMQRIVAYFNANNALPAELEVGRDLFLPANSQLLTPDGESVLDIAQLGTTNSVRIDTPGVYSVLAAASTDRVSVVLNSGESNLLALGRDELDAWEARHTDRTSNDNATTQSDNVITNELAPIDAQNTITLWRWLLPIVLLLLGIESLLANRYLWVRRDGL